MAGTRIDLARDFVDLLRAFSGRRVRFLVVGAYALAALGHPRGTADLDVWIDSTPENADRAFKALTDFGAPLHDLTPADLATPGVVFQMGLPPLRIDVLTKIDGVEFSAAWSRRVRALFGDVRVSVIGRDDFLVNKRAVGRLQDLADAERLDSGTRPVRSGARRQPRRR